MMKNLLFCIIAASVIFNFNSCKKIQDSSLIGVWQWTSSTGGIAVNTVKPSLNIIVKLEINSDLTYTTYINGQKREQGKYYLSANQNYTLIHFDKAIVTDKLFLFDEQTISKLENGKMILFDSNVSDGYSHFFDK